VENIINRTAKHWERIADARVSGIGHSPEDLWNAALAYFMWCDQNPIYKSELIRSGGDAGRVMQVPIERPYTVRGLCLHMGITMDYIFEVSRSRERSDYFFVIKTILDIIHTQVLEGTLTGIYSQVAAVKHLNLGRELEQKTNPIVQVNVIQGPGLLGNENEIEIPKDKM